MANAPCLESSVKYFWGFVEGKMNERSGVNTCEFVATGYREIQGRLARGEMLKRSMAECWDAQDNKKGAASEPVLIFR